MMESPKAVMVGAVSPQSPGGGANWRGSGKPDGSVAKKTASSWAVVGGGDEVAGAEVVGAGVDCVEGSAEGPEVVGSGVSAGIEVSGESAVCESDGMGEAEERSVPSEARGSGVGLVSLGFVLLGFVLFGFALSVFALPRFALPRFALLVFALPLFAPL